MFSTMKNQVEILQFLVSHQVITHDDKVRILRAEAYSHAQTIALLLEELQSTNKLALVDYEWQLLPNKVMKLTIVAPSGSAEFSVK